MRVLSLSRFGSPSTPACFRLSFPFPSSIVDAIFIYAIVSMLIAFTVAVAVAMAVTILLRIVTMMTIVTFICFRGEERWLLF